MMNIGICPGVSMPVVKQVLPPVPPSAARPVPSVTELAEEGEIAPAEKVNPPAQTKEPIKWWSGDSFSLKDLWDMINPLQHLPIISTLYRAFTGEGIGGVARIVGGAIYGRVGGIAGMVSSVANAVFGAFTGKDLGERIYAAVFGNSKPAETQASVARSSLANFPVLGSVAKSISADAEKLTYRLLRGESGPAAVRTVGLTNATPELDSSVVVARDPIAPRRRSTYDAVAALDLYDRLAPVATTTRSKIDRDWGND
ncbi:MAG TPA: hypothetical protein VGL11_11930 [Candidatus Binatia bacterium]|jgi:hypothetical protein